MVTCIRMAPFAQPKLAGCKVRVHDHSERVSHITKDAHVSVLVSVLSSLPVYCAAFITLRYLSGVMPKSGYLKQKRVYHKQNGCLFLNIPAMFKPYTECQRQFRHAFPKLYILNKSTICHLLELICKTSSMGDKKQPG